MIRVPVTVFSDEKMIEWAASMKKTHGLSRSEVYRRAVRLVANDKKLADMAMSEKLSDGNAS
jgi:acetyl-CoA carboxylase alpha subunit